MNSLVFKTAANFILIITLLFSVWVLFRGHNAPGGGFIGGLIAASGFALYLLAYDIKALKKIIKINLTLLLALGFMLAFCSGMIAALQHKIFLTGVWIKIKFINISLGSPILFDVGVYLVVFSSILIIMLALEEYV